MINIQTILSLLNMIFFPKLHCSNENYMLKRLWSYFYHYFFFILTSLSQKKVSKVLSPVLSCWKWFYFLVIYVLVCKTSFKWVNSFQKQEKGLKSRKTGKSNIIMKSPDIFHLGLQTQNQYKDQGYFSHNDKKLYDLNCVWIYSFFQTQQLQYVSSHKLFWFL